VGKRAEHGQHNYRSNQPKHDGQTAFRKSGESGEDEAQQNEDKQKMHNMPSHLLLGVIVGCQFCIQGFKEVCELFRRETEIPIGRLSLSCRIHGSHLGNQSLLASVAYHSRLDLLVMFRSDPDNRPPSLGIERYHDF
jgi:hypothetical protein